MYRSIKLRIIYFILGFTLIHLLACNPDSKQDKFVSNNIVIDTSYLKQQLDSIVYHSNLEDSIYCLKAIKIFNNVSLAIKFPKLVSDAYSAALIAKQGYSCDLEGDNYTALLLKQIK